MLTRIKGIQRVRAKGRDYLYHRPSGTRLYAEPGTPEFAAELARIAAPIRATPLDLGALIDLYRESSEFLQLAPRTRRDYDAVFAWLEPVRPERLAPIGRRWIKRIRDKALKAHKRRFANYVVQVLSLLFNWAIDEEILERNPAERVRQVRRPKDMPRANRPWTDRERLAVIDAARGGVRIGVALAMYAGQARGDLVRFPRAAYDGSAIAYDRRKTGAPVWMPAHRDLRAILDAAPRTGPLMVTGRRGAGYTEDGFSSSFRKMIARLEKAGAVAPGLTLHGLRHTVGKLIVEAGGSTRDVQTILGHLTPDMSEEYSRDFDRQQRARKAIGAMERNEKRLRLVKPAVKPGQGE